MDTVTATKPTFREGTNLGAILDSNEAIANQPQVVEPIVEPTPTPAASIANNGTTETAPADQAVVPTVTPPAEDNSTTFEMPSFDDAAAVETPAETQPSTQPISWEDAIKTVSQEEVLKKLGLDDWDIEMHKHRKNGGDPLDYLNAKAVDYSKWTNEEIIKDDYRKQFPHLTASKINLLYESKYGISPEATEQEIELKELALETDAYIKRQQRISQQQNFKIPAPIVTGKTPEQLQQEQLAANAQAQAAQEQAVQFYANHKATKDLMTSKRVALDLGDNISFNVNVDKPESLMRVITVPEIWQKVTHTPQGEPDVALMQEIALFAINPKKFKTDLFNYGKSFGLKTVVEEGRNAGIERPTVPGQTATITMAEALKNAKHGTVGGR